jgi:hypothetical protein
LLLVTLVFPRHKSCYEIVSSQSRNVFCGTLSQYASANLFRDGPSYEEIPEGWKRRGTVIIYKATYCPFLLFLRSLPKGVSKSELRVLSVYLGKGHGPERDRYYYWVMLDDRMPLMRTEFSGEDDISISLKYLFEEYKGN